MKKKNHFALRILGLALAIILGCLLLIFITGLISGKLYFEKDNNGKITLVIDETNGEKGTYENVIEAMNTTYPSELFVLGEDCHLPKSVSWRSIDSLTDENIATEKNIKVIIINDMHGTVSLTDDDYSFLYRKVIDGQYSLIYIGKDKLNSFSAKGIIENSFLGPDRGFCIKNYDGHGVKSIGFWDDNIQNYYDSGSTNLLPEVIISGIMHDIIRGV